MQCVVSGGGLAPTVDLPVSPGVDSAIRSSGIAPRQLSSPQPRVVDPASQLGTVQPVMGNDFREHVATSEPALRRAADDSRILTELFPARLWNRAELAA